MLLAWFERAVFNEVQPVLGNVRGTGHVVDVGCLGFLVICSIRKEVWKIAKPSLQ